MEMKEVALLEEIKFVQQLDDVSCSVACIAMVAGVSFEVALSKSCQPPLSEQESMKALVRLSVLPRRQLENCLLRGRLYIADVPSLNRKGTMHNIVIDFRDIFEVYDPQKGREGKEWYTKENCTGWANLIYCEKVN